MGKAVNTELAEESNSTSVCPQQHVTEEAPERRRSDLLRSTASRAQGDVRAPRLRRTNSCKGLTHTQSSLVQSTTQRTPGTTMESGQLYLMEPQPTCTFMLQKDWRLEA